MADQKTGTLMIRCPNTGAAISTGIGGLKEALEGSTFINNSVGCPACGQMHTWNKSDSWFQEKK